MTEDSLPYHPRDAWQLAHGFLTARATRDAASQQAIQAGVEDFLFADIEAPGPAIDIVTHRVLALLTMLSDSTFTLLKEHSEATGKSSTATWQRLSIPPGA